jgi:hypothetical protein
VTEALKKTATAHHRRDNIRHANYRKGSPEYQSAYAYLSNLEREATEILLELLAEENDRTARIFLLDLVKALGKNQLTLLGEHLSDGRWYVVRNVVSILAKARPTKPLRTSIR